MHCHIDLYPDPASIVAEIARRQCWVLAVTTTPLAWSGTKDVIGKAPRIHMALGLHPELVSERAHEVEEFRGMVAEARFVGEIGLDGSPQHLATLSLQRDVFRTILKVAASNGGRVMSIHSRRAATETLDDLERHVGASTPVLHWFSGTQRELYRAVEMGCWFSVGPAMLGSSKGRKAAEVMPVDRVLTETDGPFAKRGRTSLFPWDVIHAEEALREVWRLSLNETRQRLALNLKTLRSLANLE